MIASGPSSRPIMRSVPDEQRIWWNLLFPPLNRRTIEYLIATKSNADIIIYSAMLKILDVALPLYSLPHYSAIIDHHQYWLVPLKIYLANENKIICEFTGNFDAHIYFQSSMKMNKWRFLPSPLDTIEAFWSRNKECTQNRSRRDRSPYFYRGEDPGAAQKTGGSGRYM